MAKGLCWLGRVPLPGVKFSHKLGSCLFICNLRFWGMLARTSYVLNMDNSFSIIINFQHEMESLKVSFLLKKTPVRLGRESLSREFRITISKKWLELTVCTMQSWRKREGECTWLPESPAYLTSHWMSGAARSSTASFSRSGLLLYGGKLHYLKWTQCKSNFPVITKESGCVLESVSWWSFCLLCTIYQV